MIDAKTDRAIATSYGRGAIPPRARPRPVPTRHRDPLNPSRAQSTTLFTSVARAPEYTRRL